MSNTNENRLYLELTLSKLPAPELNTVGDFNEIRPDGGTFDREHNRIRC